MLTPRLTAAVPRILKRNIGMTATLQHPMDPIQELFLNKVREYKEKSAGGKVLQSSPAFEKERKNELERIAKQYGAAPGTDMTKFPELKFTDPKVEVGLQQK